MSVILLIPLKMYKKGFTFEAIYHEKSHEILRTMLMSFKISVNQGEI